MKRYTCWLTNETRDEDGTEIEASTAWLAAEEFAEQSQLDLLDGGHVDVWVEYLDQGATLYRVTAEEEYSVVYTAEEVSP